MENQEVFYDLATSNTSFIELAMCLKSLGVKNWNFMLAIKDKSLIGLDVHEKNASGQSTLSVDDMINVIVECRRNPWYYLRECCRIEDHVNPGGAPYKANRGNIAQAWCFHHGIDSWFHGDRQISYKTRSAFSIMGWEYLYGTQNTKFILASPVLDNARMSLRALSRDVKLLPEFMQLNTGIYTNAVHLEKQSATGNQLIPRCVRSSSLATIRDAASRMTAEIQYFDDMNMVKFADVFLERSSSIFSDVINLARMYGRKYGRMFSSSNDDIPQNKDAYRILKDPLVWVDSMYDMENQDLIKLSIESTNTRRIVLIDTSSSKDVL